MKKHSFKKHTFNVNDVAWLHPLFPNIMLVSFPADAFSFCSPTTSIYDKQTETRIMSTNYTLRDFRSGKLDEMIKNLLEEKRGEKWKSYCM